MSTFGNDFASGWKPPSGGGWWGPGAAQMEAGSVTGSTTALVGVGSTRARTLKHLKEVIKRKSPTEKKLIIAVVILALLALALLIALSVLASMRKKQMCYSEECVKSAGMFLANMDLSVDPCQDFYQYTCGRWSDNHEVEDSTYSWFADRTKFLHSKVANNPCVDVGHSSSHFVTHANENHPRVKASTTEFAAHPNTTEDDPQPLAEAKSLFTSCMDTERLDALGIEPLLEVVERTGLPKTLPDETTAASFNLAKVLAKTQRVLSMDILVQLSLSVDNATNLTIMAVGDLSSSSFSVFVSSLVVAIECFDEVQCIDSDGSTRFADIVALKKDGDSALLIDLTICFESNDPEQEEKVGPGVGGSSLPELLPRTDQRPSVGARDAVALRLAYMAGVLAEVDPSANITALPAISLKVLVVDAQVKTDIQKTESGSTLVKMTFGELQELMDNANTTGTPKLRLDWSEYLRELMSGLNTQVDLNDTVLVENTGYFVALATRLHRSRPETYQRYIWWAVVSSMVPHTTTELRGLRDELYEALFKRPRHTRPFKCAKYVKSFLNMAVSYKFATINDLKVTSEKVKWMLKDITRSFKELVASLPWMDLETKRATWKKASAIKSYIGYPKWLLIDGELEKFYKHVQINDGQFLESMVSIKAAEVKTILDSVGEPPSNQSLGWLNDPLDVNAYYGRGGNAIAIPAGILQTPFYYLGLEALNYGAIGSILGHELTHAFDIEGKEYDGDGRKISWWSDEMTKQYNDRAKCFVHQYDKFAVNKQNKVNGSLTLAENIADNGGVREALHAYKYFMRRNGAEPYLPGMENYTHEQLFFLAFANVWCEKSSESDEISSLGDVHSPNKFRVLGTLGNSPEFSEAWHCAKKTKMNPENKCILW